MSHKKRRSEKICLNCGAEVPKRFCPECGQENVEPKQTLWHLITHFFNDITHFDGKFFVTLKPLLLKPGFLSEEYVKGRRMKYIDPVRMYLFISAVFFIAYFSISTHYKHITQETDPLTVHLTDSLIQASGNKFRGIETPTIQGKEIFIMGLDSLYTQGYHHYDSVQKALPDTAKSDKFERYFEKKLVTIWAVYKADPYNFYNEVKEKFDHSFSKIFFISLPIFSFFLYFLYIRRRKEYYYVSHAIFSVHCYCVAFILLLLLLPVESEYYKLPSGLEDILGAVIAIAAFVYLYVAMLRFYKQGWFKTAVKFILLASSTSILILVIVLVLLLKSFFDMGTH